MCFCTNVSSTDVSVFDELILLLLFLKQAEEQDEDDMVALEFPPGGNKFHEIKLLFNGSLVKHMVRWDVG